MFHQRISTTRPETVTRSARISFSRTVLGLAGIPLAAALTVTTQALVLLTILNRRYPGLLHLQGTSLRAPGAALAAGLATAAVLAFLPLPSLPRTLIALMAGGLAALPLVWRELRLLLNL